MRLSKKNWKFYHADAWVAIAALDALALIVCDTVTYRYGAMDDPDIWDETLAKVGEPVKHLTVQIGVRLKLVQYSFASNYFYDTGMYFPKFSMLAFYYQLIPVTMPRLRMVLHAVTAFTVASALATCFADTFWCGANVAANW